ncbi:MAG: SRPBCC domain-containing protein [Actinobacteria bacterium]|nr:SRPBCC domain-containing protein [Actinomycetota bacterium]
MAQNTVHIDAPPEEVFAALLVPEHYADWVVGTKEVRGADDDWPAVGSRLHHTVGVGPITVRDHTLVQTIEPPRRLVLLAKAGKLGDARVEIVLAADGDGTELTMDEVAVSGPGETVPDALTEPAIFSRNGESLRRLKRLVEEGPL